MRCEEEGNLATCQARRQALNARAGAIGAVRSAGLCSTSTPRQAAACNVAFIRPEMGRAGAPGQARTS